MRKVRPEQLALLLTAVVGAAASAEGSSVTVVFVDGQVSLSGDGSSWRNAFHHLDDALDEARRLAGDDNQYEIWVAAMAPDNPYRPDRDSDHPKGTGDRTRSFELADNVRVLGGFLGNETERDQRDPENNVTVLSGDLAGNDGPELWSRWENSYNVVRAVDVGPAAVLDGFTITGGYADAPGDFGRGAGIRVGSVQPLGLASPTIARCRIVGNRVDHPAGRGAGVACVNPSSAPVLRRCVIEGNHCEGVGGGGVATVGPLIMLACQVRGNDAHGDSIGGGGVLIEGADAQLLNCVVRDNQANVGGGVSASGLIEPAEPLLLNSLLVGNTAHAVGGAVFSLNASIDIINCTVTGNVAGAIGGGFAGQGDQPPAALHNCIVWGNTPDSIAGPTAPLVRYSDIQGGFPGPGNIDANPRFLDLTFGDLRLQDRSPCLHAGDPDQSVLPLDEFDLDGDGDVATPVPDLDLLPRVRGLAVEMGAYESADCPPDVDRNGIVDVLDLILIMLSWGQDEPATDVNGDGIVNELDWHAVVAAWGDCVVTP